MLLCFDTELVLLHRRVLSLQRLHALMLDNATPLCFVVETLQLSPHALHICCFVLLTSHLGLILLELLLAELLVSLVANLHHLVELVLLLHALRLLPARDISLLVLVLHLPLAPLVVASRCFLRLLRVEPRALETALVQLLRLLTLFFALDFHESECVQQDPLVLVPEPVWERMGASAAGSATLSLPVVLTRAAAAVGRLRRADHSAARGSDSDSLTLSLETHLLHDCLQRYDIRLHDTLVRVEQQAVRHGFDRLGELWVVLGVLCLELHRQRVGDCVALVALLFLLFALRGECMWMAAIPTSSSMSPECSTYTHEDRGGSRASTRRVRLAVHASSVDGGARGTPSPRRAMSEARDR